MNLITPPAEGIYHGDKFYKLNTDFKVWLKIDSLINDSNALSPEKLIIILSLAYEKSFPEDISCALDGVLDFYSAFSKGNSGKNKKLYSFEQDASYIFSGFYSMYGIDLFETKMHWWKFRALLEELGETTLFGKILKYRSMDLESIKDKNLKRFYSKMKNFYSLDKSADIAEAFFAL